MEIHVLYSNGNGGILEEVFVCFVFCFLFFLSEVSVNTSFCLNFA